MKRTAGRDTLLLLLPFAGLAALVWWKSTIHTTPAEPLEPAAPAGLLTGPDRIVVGQWQDQPPSPLDVALGYTRVLRAPMWVGGPRAISRGPGTSPWRGLQLDETNSHLESFQRGHWVTWKDRDGSCKVPVILNELPEPSLVWWLTVKLPLGRVVPQLAKVRLAAQVHVVSSIMAIGPAGRPIPPGYVKVGFGDGKVFANFQFPPEPVLLTVRAPGRPDPRPDVLRQSNLQVTQLLVNRVPPVDSWQGLGDGAVMRAMVHWSGDVRTAKPPTLRTDSAVVSDTIGRILPPDEESVKAGWCEKCWDSDVDFVINWQVPFGQVPRSAGPLVTRTPVSVGEDWPVWIRATVRPAWEDLPGRRLVVQKVSFSMVDTYEGRKPAVTVRVRYLGKKELFVRGEGTFIKWDPSGCWNLYSEPDQRRWRRKTPTTDELVVHWSQRIENAQGKRIGPAVRAEIPTVPAVNERQIVYEIDPAILKQRGPLTFKADIGMVDDGFVPVSYRIK